MFTNKTVESHINNYLSQGIVPFINSFENEPYADDEYSIELVLTGLKNALKIDDNAGLIATLVTELTAEGFYKFDDIDNCKKAWAGGASVTGRVYVYYIVSAAYALMRRETKSIDKLLQGKVDFTCVANVKNTTHVFGNSCLSLTNLTKKCPGCYVAIQLPKGAETDPKFSEVINYAIPVNELTDVIASDEYKYVNNTFTIKPVCRYSIQSVISKGLIVYVPINKIDFKIAYGYNINCWYTPEYISKFNTVTM